MLEVAEAEETEEEEVAGAGDLVADPLRVVTMFVFTAVVVVGDDI
jgi:hypothetical protein